MVTMQEMLGKCGMSSLRPQTGEFKIPPESVFREAAAAAVPRQPRTRAPLLRRTGTQGTECYGLH